MGDRLKGKVAIVTGAGSGVPGVMGNGKAASIVYAREGTRVMLVDCNLEAAEETKRLIDTQGGESIAFRADVSNSGDCEVVIEKCIQTYGKIDILHNNVGIEIPGGMNDTSEENWDRTVNVNLKGTFLMCKFALPYMEKQGSGCIINVSSIQAIRNLTYSSVAYSVSKAGVNALTREIAVKYAPKGIRANAIMPGLMNTSSVAVSLIGAFGGNLEVAMKTRDAMCHMGKQGDAWDTAYLALFLASDEAKYITGATVVVDGGLTAQCK
jgi:NAD(P)-dependent dehydrogenase (short-subunit alcohol dehydrogenase family)